MKQKRIRIMLINKTYKEIDMTDISMIPEGIFSGRHDIYIVELPEGVETIGSNAFEGCRSLAEVKFPSTIKNIEHEAFLNCKSLRRIDLQKDVKIDPSAFKGCALEKK